MLVPFGQSFSTQNNQSTNGSSPWISHRFFGDNASVGQVFALELLVDCKLRQWAHPLAYSITYKPQATVNVAHHLIGNCSGLKTISRTNVIATTNC